MKKSLFILFLLLILPFIASAQDAFIVQADSAYAKDDYNKALSLYTQAIPKEGTSPTLYYNIGNCYYRLGKMGKAVLAYERALRLDPAFSDARENLEIANGKLNDRPGERGTLISNILDASANAMHSDLWAWLGFASFLLAIGGCALYLFTTQVLWRKVGFFGGIVLVIASACFIFFSIRAAAIAQADNYAIVTSPSTILSTAPRFPKDRSQEAMLLHEGTKIKILDSVKSTAGDTIPSLWYDARVDNDHRAWINAIDVEKI